jgi:hypothetical protein
VVTDTNEPTRPVIGAMWQLAGGVIAPVPAYWDFIFDYLEPDLQKEMAFDAVVYPRSKTNTDRFVVQWPGANYHLSALIPPQVNDGLRKGELDMFRTPGQGEFDNIHLHPYVGFDDPANAGASDDQSRAMIEAPAAADEVIHMHWRWGKQIPSAAKPENAHHFRGYSPEGMPQHEAGAPLIPPNQSLRIKIGRPEENIPVEPAPDQALSLDLSQTAVWYQARVHEPIFGEPSQFCVHGFGLAFHLDPFGPVTNKDLLGDPTVVPGYHNFRWTNVPIPFSRNLQRIPSASDIPALARNRIIEGQAPDKDKLP